MYAILRWVINAILLMIIPYLVPGVKVSNFYIALVTALVLALLNAIIRPILLVLTLPINIITLGLFTLVINGIIFWLASTFIKGFTVENFWSAFWAAIIFSLFSIVLNYFTEKE